MNAVLFFTLVIILGAALWPKNSYGRSQYHRLTDRPPPASGTKSFGHEALQKAGVKAPDVRPPEASQKATVKLCDDDSDFAALKREFEERWIAASQQEEGDDVGSEDSEKALIFEALDVEPDQRSATVANFIVTFCGEYVERYPIGGLEESVRAMRKAIALRFPNLTAMDVRKAAALAETMAERTGGRPR